MDVVEDRSIMRIARISLLFVLLIGCTTTTAIPRGAQTVNVAATDSAVRVDPAAVHTGDVYLVLDVPQRGVELVSRLNSSARESLSEDDLRRLAQNVDSEGLALESLSVSCCGNVFKVSLPAGRYAVILRDATAGVGRPPESMAILEVSP